MSLRFYDLTAYYCLSWFSHSGFLIFFIFILVFFGLVTSSKLFIESILINKLVVILLYITCVFFLFFFFKTLNTTSMQDEFVDLLTFNIDYQQYFGDTLILLVILITFFSWWFLSERYLFKNKFLIFFLLIFFFCTVNMVSTTHFILMFTFFEFIFFPSIFFAYSLSYSKKAEKTIEYLVLWTLTGAMIAFAGFGLLFYLTGTVDLSTITSYNFSILEILWLFTLFFIGFGVKIPLWPFYYWLTKVHVEAPTGFSMFLSGFLVKTAFFCFSQIFFFLYTENIFNFAVSLILWGVCDASSRMWSLLDIKRLIALATVQEMNMIMIFLFFLSNSNYTILNSFLLIHGLLSVFFFFLVDMVYKQAQTRNLTILGGLGISSFKLLSFIWLAVLIYRGFPVFSKFFVEWELTSLLLQNLLGFGFFLFLLFSMLGAGSFFKHWTSTAYSSPEFLNTQNILTYRDFTIGNVCVGLLFVLNFNFYLF